MQKWHTKCHFLKSRRNLGKINENDVFFEYVL
jgi:hypothetical protein